MKRTIAIIIILSLILFVIGGVAWAENYETLQVGSYGSAVKELQKRLIELKFLSGSGADGSYGQGTEKAITKFQKASGLPETGIADAATLEQLYDENAVSGPDFTFSTTDRDGKVWNESAFSDYKLIMINFWEPWCGPCVREMPDLEKLYEQYKADGFLILGVYSTTNRESEVKTILKDAGISYPILKYTGNFKIFESGYVPTTVFVDGQGHVLYPEMTAKERADAAEEITKLGSAAYSKYGALYIGSDSYAGWKSIVDKLI